MKPKKEMLCIPIDPQSLELTMGELKSLPICEDRKAEKGDVFSLLFSIHVVIEPN